MHAYKRGERASADCETHTVVHFHENAAIYFFRYCGIAHRAQNPTPIRTYVPRAIFLAFLLAKQKRITRPRRCFLRSCLLLTYEQTLIEVRLGYYYCTRDVRNTHARSSRTHPSRELGSRNANTTSSCSCCESRYDRLPQLRRARRVVFLTSS